MLPIVLAILIFTATPLMCIELEKPVLSQRDDFSFYPQWQGEGKPSFNLRNEWTPIGTFMVGTYVTDETYSEQYFQLSINRRNNISGTYYNAITGETFPLAGTLIQETEQVLWKFIGKENSPLMVAGLSNLEKNMVPVEVRMADGRKLTLILVRVSD